MNESKQQKILDWLDNQEGGYVNVNRLNGEFPDVDFSLHGVTMVYGENGMEVPKRDVRQAVLYGVPLD